MREKSISDTFALTPRERFLGPGPWRVYTALGYLEIQTDHPTFLYQDIVIALTEKGSINNGQPTLHAKCLAALNAKEGDTVIHVGAGTGYYTALLSKLVGSQGLVFAYEIEQELAQWAIGNLADLPTVTVYPRSGSGGILPRCDILYVNVGATAPLNLWLDALRPGSRLLFPLTRTEGAGGMLLITHRSSSDWDARYMCPAMIIPCVGARDDETAQKLSVAFKQGNAGEIRSLGRGPLPDNTLWCLGSGGWLSKSAIP